MQASFGKEGEITVWHLGRKGNLHSNHKKPWRHDDKGAGAHPGTAEGLGGVNIEGIHDPKAQVDANQEGRNVETDASSEPITTGRAPIGYDAGAGEVATLEDPGTGNTKTAAGRTTTAGNPKTALPGQTGP